MLPVRAFWRNFYNCCNLFFSSAERLMLHLEPKNQAFSVDTKYQTFNCTHTSRTANFVLDCIQKAMFSVAIKLEWKGSLWQSTKLKSGRNELMPSPRMMDRFANTRIIGQKRPKGDESNVVLAASTRKHCRAAGWRQYIFACTSRSVLLTISYQKVSVMGMHQHHCIRAGLHAPGVKRFRLLRQINGSVKITYSKQW